MAPGLKWEDHLWEELKRSGNVLVVVSSHAGASSWMRDEVECAAKLQRTDPSIAIIPLPIDMTSPARILPELATYQYADFTHPIKYEDTLRRLVYVLEHPGVLKAGAVLLPQVPLTRRVFRSVVKYFWGIFTGLGGLS